MYISCNNFKHVIAGICCGFAGRTGNARQVGAVGVGERDNRMEERWRGLLVKLVLLLVSQQQTTAVELRW